MSNSKVFMSSQLKDANRMFALAEVLLWRAQQSGLGFVVEKQTGSSVTKAKVKSPEYDWDWGFRLGFGYTLPHDDWDVVGSYTQFQTQTNDVDHSSEDKGLYPTYLFRSIGTVDSVSAKWNLHLQMADLEVGKDLPIGQRLCIRPHAGVRGAWIFQKYTIDYSGGSLHKLGDREVMLLNNFFGIGARVGFDSLWNIAKGFSIFGDGSISLLSGFFGLKNRQQNTQSGATTFNVSSDPSTVVTFFDVIAGFQYDMFFKDHKYHLGIKAGYEFNYLFNQYQFLSAMNGNSTFYNSYQNDLSFMGLTFGLRFDF
jgi:hypothetical protein